MKQFTTDIKPVAIETFCELYDFENANGKWLRYFTQVTIFNQDPNEILTVETYNIPADSALSITLNTNQVNTTALTITSSSATRSCFIIYSCYRDFNDR
mgnify:CR=1 FL=1